MTLAKLFTAASAAALLAALPACAQEDQQENPTEGQNQTEDTLGGMMQDAADDIQDELSTAADEMTTTSTASGRIINRDREAVGTVTFQQGQDGVVVTIEADLSAGTGQWHGAHLHQVGDCSNNDFTSSGGHINPDGNAHGFLNADGPDNADLPNVWLHTDGTMRAQAYTTRVSVDGQTDAPALLDADGSALVIHENQDDMEAQPIGGAGARILCAVIEAGAQ
ncbi:superoxide dismutase family protein [Maricaulaceae bacterium MS644]